MRFPVNTQACRLVARQWPLVAILALIAPPAAAQEGGGETPEEAPEEAPDDVEPPAEPAAVEPVAPAAGQPLAEPAAVDPVPAPADTPAAATAADDKDPNRFEFGVLPALNYDSDLGFGFGVIGTLVRFNPDFRPYRWRIKYLLYATVKSSPGGGTEFAYHDDNILLDRPGLMENKLRLQIQAGFRRASTAAYYGLGNASEDTESDNARFYQYDRIYPYGQASGRFQLWDRSTSTHARRLEAFAGLGFWYNVMNLYQNSLLEMNAQLADQDTPDGRALAALLHGTDDHMLMMPSIGLLWDTRDHEHTPTRGNFTELSLRASPGLEDDLYFVGASVITRWFQSISGDTLVLAVRGIGDALLGNPPFYEMGTVGSFTRTEAPGGGSSVRGVAGQRFHGKLKVVGNLELRAQLLPFRVAGQRFNLGAIAFVDVGRVWADYGDVEIAGESLDDGLTNFAMGVGAGLRLKWGETFIVRVDPGYSPTEKTFGLYINVDHIF
jgi:Omp85 superfamily domain